jgi:hypothetical protein
LRLFYNYMTQNGLSYLRVCGVAEQHAGWLEALDEEDEILFEATRVLNARVSDVLYRLGLGDALEQRPWQRLELWAQLDLHSAHSRLQLESCLL